MSIETGSDIIFFMEESASLNIVYLPDEQTRNKAIELSQKVASKLSTEFILGQGAIPHITIYQAEFPNKNITKVKEAIKEFASQTAPFGIEMGPFWINAVRNFVWWNCIKTNQLSKIHWGLMKKINPLREGLVPDSLKAYKVTEQDKMEIENYGALFMGKRYTPHLTVSGLKNPSEEKEAFEVLGMEEHSTFIVDKISLGYLGRFGTVTGIIEEFPLVS